MVMVKENIVQTIANNLKNDALEKSSPPLEKDILQDLLQGIQKLNFKVIAFPELIQIKKRIDQIEQNLLIKESDSDNRNQLREEISQLKSSIKSKKLTKAHYLVICIEKLLSVARERNLSLCKSNGQIYLYNGTYWDLVDKEQFQYFLGEVALKMGLDKFKSKFHSFKDDLHKQFLSDAFLPNPKTNKQVVLVNFQNGTLELNGGAVKLREHRAQDFIKYVLPFDYNPFAKSPLFDRFINEVLPDIDKQNVLSEYCGYVFLKNDFLKLEKMLLLYGGGANGKSVFFEVMTNVFGQNNVCNFGLGSLTGESGYSRAFLPNFLVNYTSEINGKMESHIAKQLISGEPVEARLPYQEPMIIRDYAKLIFNTNELPFDVEHTNAFYRRFLIINFDVTVPPEKQDRYLAKKIIENELSGVFNWVLEGLFRLCKQKGLSSCRAADEALSEFKSESDNVKLFLDEENYKVSAFNFIPIKDLYRVYVDFCRDGGYRPVKKLNFTKRLDFNGVVVDRKSIGKVAFLELGQDNFK